MAKHDNEEVIINDIRVSRTIFRSYDIRGVADTDPLEPDVIRTIDLTARQAWLIGKAYGTWVQRNSGNNIVVGRDNRRTSVDLATGFIVGALSTGCNVLDIGLSTTPLLYFGVNYLQCDGGLMVTGSHNPMWSNGLKLSKAGFQTLVGPEIQDLYELIVKSDFMVGEGVYKEADILNDYIDALYKRAKPAVKRLKVVIDPGNATASLTAPRLLERLGYEVIPIHAEMIYPFPNGSPDPEQPDKVAALGKKVRELKADIGIAYDGDADRIGVIDEKGQKLESDLLVLFLARDIIKENPEAEIVFDVKCSDVLIDDIRKHGGVPLMWKTGHSNIKQKMAEDAAQGKPALFGGELSGHIFFKDRFYGFDDAVYASARVLEILSRSELPMSEQLSDLPELVTTREIAIPCPDDKKQFVVETLKKTFEKKGYKLITLDGVRIVFAKNKWALVRQSNTQPKLTARFQARDEENLLEIVSLIKEELKQFDFVKLDDLDKGVQETIG